MVTFTSIRDIIFFTFSVQRPTFFLVCDLTAISYYSITVETWAHLDFAHIPTLSTTVLNHSFITALCMVNCEDVYILLLPMKYHIICYISFCLDLSCLWNQFACSKNKCIAKQWLCDGENDCEDRLDESVQICGKYPWSCGNTLGEGNMYLKHAV